MSLQPGTSAQASLVVGAGDLASDLAQNPADGFPPVFATARMIGLMELAASRAMHALLHTGEMSVGVSIDAHHTAATPPGHEVTATATFTGMQGRLYAFEIVAQDPGGEIGRASHLRAIVDTGRLLQGAERRLGGG